MGTSTMVSNWSLNISGASRGRILKDTRGLLLHSHYDQKKNSCKVLSQAFVKSFRNNLSVESQGPCVATHACLFRCNHLWPDQARGSWKTF